MIVYKVQMQIRTYNQVRKRVQDHYLWSSRVIRRISDNGQLSDCIGDRKIVRATEACPAWMDVIGAGASSFTAQSFRWLLWNQLLRKRNCRDTSAFTQSHRPRTNAAELRILAGFCHPSQVTHALAQVPFTFQGRALLDSANSVFGALRDIMYGVEGRGDYADEHPAEMAGDEPHLARLPS